jgi:sugar phosphate isomerase/epimerase
LERDSVALPLAVQLYTFRNAIGADRAAALARTAEQGFRSVEPFGIGGFSPDDAADRLANAKALRALYDQNGLSVVATHAVWSPAAFASVLDEVKTIGTDRVIAPAPGCIEGHGDAMKSADGVKAFAGALNEAAAAAEGTGIQVGYHNHEFEWAKLPDGSYPYDLLVANLDSRVFLEVDVYWAATGLQNPAEVIDKYKERVQLLHIKDGPAVRGELQVQVGQGSVDNVAAIHAGPRVSHAIIELDECAGDPFDVAKAGGEWLVAQGEANW